MSIDLHCHTKLSDGSLGIDDLIMVAKKSGMTAIAITDHDSLAGTRRGQMIGERLGLQVIPGVEFSAYNKEREQKAHILCYLPEFPDRLEGLCHRNIVARKKASQLMTLKIARKYPITPELVLKCATGSTAVFEQHIMHALMECGLTDKIYGDLYYELFSPESPENVLVKANYPEPAEVIEAIHEAGGIAVYSHPSTEKDVEAIRELAEKGLDGIEVWHPSIDDAQKDILAEIAREFNLLSVGGTEFMGMYSKKSVSLGEYTAPDAAVKALTTYKAKMKKKKAAEAEK